MSVSRLHGCSPLAQGEQEGTGEEGEGKGLGGGPMSAQTYGCVHADSSASVQTQFLLRP